MALNALFVGATGLYVNSTALDIVGNNLANLSTTGFKGQRVLFKDVVYQTIDAGTGLGVQTSSTNPIQFGFGVNIGSIDSILKQGSLNPTGRGLDAGIDGSGFFVASDGAQILYTRSGAFSVDSDGFLVDPSTGYRIQRFGTVGEPTGTAPGFQTPGVNDISVPIGATIPGQPTTTVNLQGNLSTTLQVGQSAGTSIQVFDSLSAPRTLTTTFTKTGTNAFSVSTAISGGTATPATTAVTFDANGLLVAPATVAVAIDGIAGAAAQTITLNLGTPGQTNGVTQLGDTTTVSEVTQNGSGFGTLSDSDVSIDATGTLLGQFSNGLTVPIAQLALAGFANPGGLLRSGQNYFLTSPASGPALVGVAGQGGLGSVMGGSLEAANVDIPTEFSRLIIALRGFQVNTRTITAANDSLQELSSVVR